MQFSDVDEQEFLGLGLASPFRVSGFQGLGFEVCCSGFSKGLVFRVQGLGFQGLGFGVLALELELRV